MPHLSYLGYGKITFNTKVAKGKYLEVTPFSSFVHFVPFVVRLFP